MLEFIAACKGQAQQQPLEEVNLALVVHYKQTLESALNFEYQQAALTLRTSNLGPVVRRVHIAPIKLHVSFRIERDSDRENMQNLLTYFLGISFISVEDAPISISSIRHEQAASLEAISTIVYREFKNSLLTGLFSVIGSFTLVGNPYSFVRYVTYGSYELL